MMALVPLSGEKSAEVRRLLGDTKRLRAGQESPHHVPRAGWVDWLNNRRCHGVLEMLIPVEFEMLHPEALARGFAPAK